MGVTIKDVAKASEVSPSTVSRVISDNPRISDETKIKVRKAMDALGYYPNAIARSLTNQMTHTLGILIPRSTDEIFKNPFFPELLRGIGHVAQENEYHLLLPTGTNEDDEIEKIKRFVFEKRVDGIIALTSKKDDKFVDTLIKSKFPFVVIGMPYKHAEKVFWVDNDNLLISKNITKYLVEKGNEKIAMLCGSFDYVVTYHRVEGYKSALSEGNMAINKDYIISSDFSEESGYEAAKKLLALENPPTAIITSDDLIAFGAMKAIKEMGLRIPEDIEVTGFNNAPLSNYTNPKLTTVDINAYSLGCNAAEALLIKISGEEIEENKIIVPAEIIIRESTKV